MTNTSSQTNRRDLQQNVTDIIVKQLEQGTIPWQQPWIGNDNRLPPLPKNIVTNKKYRGINILLLWTSMISANYTSAEWASFKQWQEKNEFIRKGEKGSLVVYYDTFEKEVDGEIKNIPFLKSSFVFNRCQLVSHVSDANTITSAEKPLFEIIPPVEDFIHNTGAMIEHGGDHACYIPSQDKICMPEMDRFIATATCTATEGYYSTLLHELAHWTGSPNRLDRKKGKKFGEEYAVDELVAELGAAFLCADFGIAIAEKGDHAAYIEH